MIVELLFEEEKGETVDIVGGQKVLRHTFVKKSNRQPGTSTASHSTFIVIVTSTIWFARSNRSSLTQFSSPFQQLPSNVNSLKGPTDILVSNIFFMFSYLRTFEKRLSVC